MSDGQGRGSRIDPRKPYQPAIGTEFVVEQAASIAAKTRGFLARYVSISAGVAVVVTGGYGLLTGNYAAVEVVWAVAGPIIGAMMAYYFGPQRNDTG